MPNNSKSSFEFSIILEYIKFHIEAVKIIENKSSVK